MSQTLSQARSAERVSVGTNTKPAVSQDGRARVAIENVSPQVDGGRFPIKRVAGDTVTVDADVFTDGHDAIAAMLLHRGDDKSPWQRIPMRPSINDRWTGEFKVERLGTAQYKIVAWIDQFATWQRDLSKRAAARQKLDVELLVGAELVDAAVTNATGTDRGRLEEWSRRLTNEQAPLHPREFFESAELHELMLRWHEPPAISESRTLCVTVDRPKAAFSAWYEMFPRSAGRNGKHGTLKDVEAWLPYIERMGFDVLYLPPIHPVGNAYRKGPNNAETAGPSDFGSPWAIGSEDGGHKSIHPELGTMQDFRSLLRTAASHGLELRQHPIR
jgi:starch synthase (maltosyl-transferring)